MQRPPGVKHFQAVPCHLIIKTKCVCRKRRAVLQMHVCHTYHKCLQQERQELGVAGVGGDHVTCLDQAVIVCHFGLE